MRLSQEMQNLVRALEEATDAGRAKWYTTADGERFAVSFGKASVIIGQLPASGMDAEIEKMTSGVRPRAFTLDILNSQGQVVDGIVLQPDDENHVRISNLYERVRRSVTKADELIGFLIGQLQGTGSR